jgi:hypothetical protein
MRVNNMIKKQKNTYLIIISSTFLMLSSCQYVAPYLAEKTFDCVLMNNCPGNSKNGTTPGNPSEKISPEKAVESYYQLINQQQYTDAWNCLTPDFQMLSKNYDDYRNWWNSVGASQSCKS